MTEKKKATTKKKPRRVYKDEAGNKLPSVTEILGGLGWKYGPLMQWANRLGREGKTLSEGSRDAMEIGSVAHDMIESWLLGRGTPEHVKEVPEHIWTPAFNCFEKFEAWYLEAKWDQRFQILGTEVAMVDRTRRFGGTADLVGVIDGVPIMLDYKTGKSVYAETSVQLAAYCQLWDVDGYRQSEDSEGNALPDALRIARHDHRFIQRCGIIHVPVDGPVRLFEIPPDVVYTANRIWDSLVEMQKWKKNFDGFSKALAAEVKRDDGEEGGSESKAPF